LTSGQRYRLVAGAAVLHAALPITLGWLGILARSGDAAVVGIVAAWWSWPFVWLFPLWRARHEDTRAWWTGLVLSLLLLGLAAPAVLFVTAILAGGKT
jgi:hypothetical protein